MDDTKPDILAVFAAVGYEVPSFPKETGWTKIRCPLPQHDDRTPSASINTELNRWTCYSCNLSEDSWDLYCRERGVSLGQARKQIAAELGVSFEIRAVRRNGGAVSSRRLWSD